MKKFLSRKIIVLVLTTIATPFLDKLGVPHDMQLAWLGTVAAWLLGQSAVDAAAAANGSAASAVIAKSGTPEEVAVAVKAAPITPPANVTIDTKYP